MNENFKGFWGFWRGVFSEPDGTPSFSRIATAVLVSFACGWVTALIRYTHTLPSLLDLGLFITVLYGTNQLRAGWGKKEGADAGKNQPS